MVEYILGKYIHFYFSIDFVHYRTADTSDRSADLCKLCLLNKDFSETSSQIIQSVIRHVDLTDWLTSNIY